MSFLLLAIALPGPGRADDWPHWHGPQRDSVWRETGVLATFPPGGPPVRWRTPGREDGSGNEAQWRWRTGVATRESWRGTP